MYLLKNGSLYFTGHIGATATDTLADMWSYRQKDAKRFSDVMVDYLRPTTTIAQLFGTGARFVKLKPRAVAVTTD
jgi:hypothetical protein